MREVPFRQVIVCLDGSINVFSMNPDGNSHQHVLRPFRYFPVYFQEIRLLECLEAKVAVGEVAFVHNAGVQDISVFHDDAVMEV